MEPSCNSIAPIAASATAIRSRRFQREKLSIEQRIAKATERTRVTLDISF
jgi:hypothetical protein